MHVIVRIYVFAKDWKSSDLRRVQTKMTVRIAVTNARGRLVGTGRLKRLQYTYKIMCFTCILFLLRVAYKISQLNSILRPASSPPAELWIETRARIIIYVYALIVCTHGYILYTYIYTYKRRIFVFTYT